MPPPNKSKKHSERKLLKNIPIEVETPKDSIESKKHAMFSLILKKDNFMISMVKKGSKTEDLLELEICLIFSTPKKIIDPKK